MIAYLFACGLAHRAALEQVKDFADANKINVVRMGALPTPPSLLTWGGAIRTSNGVYQARIDLRDRHATSFQFIADSPADAFTARALELPDVQLYWTFARFPLIRASTEEDFHIIDFGENRFVSRDTHRPQPFTYRVAFDSQGTLVEEGWLTDEMLLKNTEKTGPAAEGTQ